MSEEQYKRWIADAAHLSQIVRWLGKGRVGDHWKTLNKYLPKKETLPFDYKNLQVVSEYDSVLDGIILSFPGFDSFLSRLAAQVVFKISDGNNDTLEAKLKNGGEYILDDTLKKNFKLLSWTIKRVYSQYQEVNYEAAEVTMNWGYRPRPEGDYDDESKQVWDWLPYKE